MFKDSAPLSDPQSGEPKPRDEDVVVRFHIGMACVSVASLTFLLDTFQGNIEKSDRFFVANWTWQFLMLAAGSVWAKCGASSEELAQGLGTALRLVAAGIACNALSFVIMGRNPLAHTMDCVFQMWFVVAAMLACAWTFGLKRQLMGDRLTPAALLLPLLATCFAYAIHSRSAQDAVQQLAQPSAMLLNYADASYSGAHHLSAKESIAFCTFFPIGMSGLGLLGTMVAASVVSEEGKGMLGWYLAAYVYGCRLLLPCEHSAAFYLHLINLFVLAVLVGGSGLRGTGFFYQLTKYFPWLLLFFCLISQGEKWTSPVDQTDIGQGQPLSDRVPYNVVEAAFVLCYFCAADHIVFAQDKVDQAKEWAPVAFVAHPLVWRLLPPLLAYPVLLAGTCGFFVHLERKAYVPLGGQGYGAVTV